MAAFPALFFIAKLLINLFVELKNHHFTHGSYETGDDVDHQDLLLHLSRNKVSAA